MRKCWWGTRATAMRAARLGQGGTCVIGVLLIHDGIYDAQQSRCQGGASVKDASGGAGTHLWVVGTASRPTTAAPPGLRPTGLTSLPRGPGRASGSNPPPLWPERGAVCLCGHTPRGATIVPQSLVTMVLAQLECWGMVPERRLAPVRLVVWE